MTGVSAATLRAWERRYGIPAPQRTASAYRLYSDRDIEMIRRVRELCEGGVAPAQAAEMVRGGRGGREEAVRIEADTTELAIRNILAAVERLDADMIEAAVRMAMYSGPTTSLFDRVYGPVLAEVGERWSAGTMNAAQEHLVSEVVGSALRDVLRLSRPVRPSHSVVLACFADDEHVLPLLGAALTLTEWNMRTVVLGARTPAAAIAHVVAEIRPDLVGLSMTVPIEPERAAPMLEEYAVACGTTPWLVGGQAAGALHELIAVAGGVVAPDSRARLRATIERLTDVRLGERTAPPARAS
ncbi:MAG: MerR family transcriptional regulator [Myxococcales bacterium]|nr:MerR family transcriptional regulator [Myxococcales bacterium]